MVVTVTYWGCVTVFGQQDPDRQSGDAEHDDQPPAPSECLPVITPLHRSPAFSLLVGYAQPFVAVPYPAASRF